jgi:hypothetical protein
VPALLAVVLIPHHLRDLPIANADHLWVSARSEEQAFAMAKEAADRAAAFRRVVAHVGHNDTTRAFVGRAVSTNFFKLQQVAPAIGTGFTDSDEREVILSHQLWRVLLHSDPGAVGRRLEVNGESYRIAGVMPERYWLLDRVNRFWLRSPAYRGTRSRGALLVLVGPNESDTEATEALSNSPIRLVTLAAVSEAPVRVAQAICGAALVLLALLGVLQTWSLLKALGAKRVPFATLLRNYAFLFAKAVPILAAAAVLWIAASEGELLSPASFFGGVSMVIATFVFALFTVATAWQCLVDQRLRCPMCLRKLSMPVPLGVIGSILFDSPGTEYICTYGHGTLYIPEPTSEGLREPTWKEPADIWAELLGSSPARLG